jgi:nucleoside-diphosphate-sugar epimerase
MMKVIVTGGTGLIGSQLVERPVRDQVVDALLRVTANIVGQPINIGSGQVAPIHELAERLPSSSSADLRIKSQPALVVEIARFSPHVSRMGTFLDLMPHVDLLRAVLQPWERYCQEAS